MANKELNIYEKFLTKIIYWFNPCYTEQLLTALQKSFANVGRTEAIDILWEFQKHGRILLSKDGIALTKQMYITLTGDDKLEKIHFGSDFRVNKIKDYIQKFGDSHWQDQTDCLWIMIDLLPESIDFSVLCRPFDLSFITSKHIYEVIKIREDREDTKAYMLTTLPQDFFPQFKEKIIRIAVMENGSHAFKVPNHVGIKYICVIDDTNPRHYRIVENRKEIW